MLDAKWTWLVHVEEVGMALTRTTVQRSLVGRSNAVECWRCRHLLYCETQLSDVRKARGHYKAYFSYYSS